jgi:hypothetical protein
LDATVKTPDINKSVTTPGPAAAGLQPFLHDAVVTLCAPSFVISHADGQLSADADGFYHGDLRALSRLVVTAEGIVLAPVSGGLRGADRADFRAILRGVGEVTADPAVSLHRHRTVSSGRLEETIEVSNAGTRLVRFRLSVQAATDLAPMERVKSGHPQSDMTAQAVAGALVWARDQFTVRLHSTPAPNALDATAGQLSYDVELAPGQSWSALLACTAAHDEGDQFPTAPADQMPWRTPVLRSADRQFDRWLEQSLADLDRLRLTDPLSSDAGEGRADQFLAAGAPWYLTLFGRDAIWAARMLLPLGTDLAAGTLRTLARRQGQTVDPATEEQPGKILHEVRRTAQEFTDTFALPPVYYGTVDATPLWITLLHDAWRWGMSPKEVEQLLPHAESALSWMRDHCDADGFLKYIDHTGQGLANQGWKDSDDAILHRDGRLAEAPIALCEVQAYAYEAARGGAALLRAFGRPGADAWDEWAQQLADRFRKHFWVEDERGPYPAVAGELGDLGLRPPARHGAAEPRGERPAGGPPQCARPRFGPRAAHAEPRRGGLQSLRLPHRFDLAPRHSHRRVWPGPGRVSGRSGIVGGGTAHRLGRLRRPPARCDAMTGEEFRQAARALSRLLPAAGMGSGSADPRAPVRLRPCRRCARRNGDGGTHLCPPVRPADGDGTSGRRTPAEDHHRGGRHHERGGPGRADGGPR